MNNPTKWIIAKKWARENYDISLASLISILNEKNANPSHDEKTLVGMILSCFPKLRAQMGPAVIEKWLENVQGWEQIDNLCQNNFKYTDFLNNWDAWEKALNNFSKSPNICKRRASIVLLVGPVTYSPDNRFSNLAFKNVDILKKEKDILITKAISWILRALIKNHRQEVEEYLEKNKESLPKIAIRETRNKLSTGRKNSIKRKN